MSEPFFIETSQGIINRSEILYIDNYVRMMNIPSICIWINNSNIVLEGEEARMFLSAIPVKLIVGKAGFEEVRNFNQEDLQKEEKDASLIVEDFDTLPY